MFSAPKKLKKPEDMQLAELTARGVELMLKPVYKPSKLDNVDIPGYLQVMDEMRSMINKAGIESSTLMTTYTSLFYDDQVGGADKNGKFGTFPLRLSLLGALKARDPSEFSELFDHSTIGGFYVRNIFGLACPEEPYQTRWYDSDDWKKFEFQTSFSRPEFPKSFLTKMQAWQQAPTDPEIRKGRVGGRLGEIALRIAYITSGANGDPCVTEKAYQAAIAFVEWQEIIRAVYRPAEGETPDAQCMHAVLAFYEKYRVYNWRNACKRNNWHRKFASSIRKVRNTLEADGVLREHKGKHYLVPDETNK